ncbi:MAG: hypothetical protein UH850_09840 [Paludibacteraceae bacterium]|nr:hypothetical protein [Paludibacteraceae bacterium]
MKKLLLMGVALSAALTTFSADQFYVIMKDGSVESYPSDKVDSISFDDPQIAKIMGFNDMAAEIVKLKERVEALEAGMGTVFYGGNIKESVAAGDEYFVRHPSVDFSFKVKSVKGGYLTKDQVVEIEIEGNIFTMSDAGAVFLMWTEEDGFRMVNMVEAKENAKDIVMYLACFTSTADYTITSPTEHPSLVANGALESKFLKRH